MVSQRGATRAADKNQNQHGRAHGLTQRQVVHGQESKLQERRHADAKKRRGRATRRAQSDPGNPFPR